MDNDGYVLFFWAAWVLTTLMAVFADRAIEKEAIEQSIALCEKNGGLEMLAVDMTGTTVYCINGANFDIVVNYDDD